MTEEADSSKVDIYPTVKTRGLLLSVLSLYAFVYFAVIAVIFLVSLIYSKHIASVVNIYVPEDAFTPSQIFLLFLTGFLLNVLAFIGVTLIWKMRRIGFWLLTLSSTLIIVFQLLMPRASLTSTLGYLLLVLLFALFYRRLR